MVAGKGEAGRAGGGDEQPPPQPPVRARPGRTLMEETGSSKGSSYFTALTSLPFLSHLVLQLHACKYGTSSTTAADTNCHTSACATDT